jgi:hypothetical protein
LKLRAYLDKFQENQSISDLLGWNLDFNKSNDSI